MVDSMKFVQDSVLPCGDRQQLLLLNLILLQDMFFFFFNTLYKRPGYIFLHTCNTASCNGLLYLGLMIIAYFMTVINFPHEFKRFLCLIWKSAVFTQQQWMYIPAGGAREPKIKFKCSLAFLSDHYSDCGGFSPAIPWGFTERPILSAGAFGAVLQLMPF